MRLKSTSSLSCTRSNSYSKDSQPDVVEFVLWLSIFTKAGRGSLFKISGGS